jgi:hypothetical protein
MAVIHRCGACPREWTGLAECHCGACHEHFGGITAFDAHRGGGDCHKPGRLRDPNGEPKLITQARSSGLVWVFPGSQYFPDGSESADGGRTPG